MLINKRGSAGDNSLVGNVMYLIVFLLIAAPTFIFINAQKDGAATWEDFYAKEIARIINSAEPGTEVFLDVTKAAEITGTSIEEVFSFDNLNNEVIVSLRARGGTAFSFFNDVDVVDLKIEDVLGDEPKRLLYFRIVESEVKDE